MNQQLLENLLNHVVRIVVNNTLIIDKLPKALKFISWLSILTEQISKLCLIFSFDLQKFSSFLLINEGYKSYYILLYCGNFIITI